MISQKKYQIGIILFSLALTSCSSIPYFRHERTAKLTPRQQLCASLRHQIIFKDSPIGPNQLRSPPTHQARVIKEYQRYNCDDFQDKSVTED